MKNTFILLVLCIVHMNVSAQSNYPESTNISCIEQGRQYYTKIGEEYMQKLNGLIMQINDSSDVSVINRANNFKDKIGLPITFFLSGPLADSSEIALFEEGPCGGYVKYFTQNMNEIPDGIGLETVYEIDDNRSVVQSWKIPYESRITGIDKDEIYIQYRVPFTCMKVRPEKASFLLAIDTNGQLRITDRDPADFSKPVAVDINKIEKIPYSEFKGIADFEEPGTKEKRRLVFNFICS